VRPIGASYSVSKTLPTELDLHTIRGGLAFGLMGSRRATAGSTRRRYSRRKRFTIGMFATRPWASTRRSLAIIALPRTCAHPALLTFAIRDSKSGLANTSRNLVSVGVRGQPHKLAESRQGPPS